MPKVQPATAIRLANAQAALCEMGLQDALRYVLNNNPSKGLGYHNEEHLLVVVSWVYQLGTGEMVSSSDLESLMLAALFHDFNHSGGEFSDAVNVKRAIEGFGSWFRNSKRSKDLVLHDTVVLLIACTEYPWKREPKTQLEKIIRDADLMQMFEPNYVQRAIWGLRPEIERLHGRTYTVQEFCKGQADFSRNLVFYTEEGRRAASAAMDIWEETFRILANYPEQAEIYRVL